MLPVLQQQLATRLIALRRKAGKSQEAVASHLGISQQGYSLYETGKVCMPFDKCVSIYRYLGGDLGELTTLASTSERPAEGSR